MPEQPPVQDAILRRYQRELEERSAQFEGITEAADEAGRDLTPDELTRVTTIRDRMQVLQTQVESLESTIAIASQVRERSQNLDRALSAVRSAPVDFQSAGHYLLDTWKSISGDREARDRLDVYQRAASHQKTTDTLGIVPDPIVGPVVSFIDGTRPLVSMIGPQPLTHGTWYRPKVTQHVTVGVQGAAGGAADEKTELLSQKMVISRITGTAKTYGGYVNVSRQDIDFSAPNALDTVVTDLAANYGVQTEAAMGTSVLTASGTPVEIAGANTAAHTPADLITALFTALAQVYAVAKGAGRYYIACSPDKVGVWAPLFAPVNVNPAVAGVNASTFGNGLQLNVAGIPLLVSAGLTAGTIGVVTTTAAFECFEQRIGTLSIAEPSVLGVQVAYAGYFTPVPIDATAGTKIIDAA